MLGHGVEGGNDDGLWAVLGHRLFGEKKSGQQHEGVCRHSTRADKTLYAAIWYTTLCRQALEEIASRGCREDLDPSCGRCEACIAARAVRQAREWRPQQANPSDESIIAPEGFFAGQYRCDHNVRVQGRVEGSIESKGLIYIDRNARVVGNLIARDITVAGCCNGNIECRGRFEITSTGIVEATLNTDVLVVQSGGYFDGELRMRYRSGFGRSVASPQPALTRTGPVNHAASHINSEVMTAPAL